MNVFEYDGVVSFDDLAADGFQMVPATDVAACFVTTKDERGTGGYATLLTECVWVETRGVDTRLWSSDQLMATDVDVRGYTAFGNPDGVAILPRKPFHKKVGNKPRADVMLAVRTEPNADIENKTRTDVLFVELPATAQSVKAGAGIVRDKASTTFRLSGRGLTWETMDKFFSQSVGDSSDDVFMNVGFLTRAAKVMDVVYKVPRGNDVSARIHTTGSLSPVHFERSESNVATKRVRVLAMPCRG